MSNKLLTNNTFFPFMILSFLLLIPYEGLAQEKKLLRKQDYASEIKNYKRSSLFVMSIDNPNNQYTDIAKSVIKDYEISQNFNEHKLDMEPFIVLYDSIKDKSSLVTKKLQEEGIARKLVAKWFNQDENGFFNLDLIKERGLYNASALDIQMAQNTMRGKAILEDAGEHLIGNTFVVVHDFKYMRKEDLAKKANGIISTFESITGKSTGEAKAVITSVAKGYVIKTTSYLYRLKWDQNTSDFFFMQMWADKNNPDQERIKAFEETDFFKLEYIGKQDALAHVFSIRQADRTKEELIQRAVINASNGAVSKLERKFEVFRIKTPLISVNPLAAKIGLKEGLKKGDRFEVLEQIVSEDGTITYKKVGVIKVDKDHIWDNSYLPDDQTESKLPYTLFKGKTKKLYPGMLIRYKKNTNLNLLTKF